MLNSENYQTILSPQYCTHATSILYQHYKCLVLALQVFCTDATNQLVPMLKVLFTTHSSSESLFFSYTSPYFNFAVIAIIVAK